MSTNIRELAEQYNDYIIERRRYYHSCPELSGQEIHTTEALKADLEAMGVEVELCKTCHGLVGTIKGGKPGKAVVALRSDTDALPVEEKTGLPFASENPGVMHACGHDNHMAMLLGAAKILTTIRDEIPGTVKLLFQPAEETAQGAKAMIAEGVLKVWMPSMAPISGAISMRRISMYPPATVWPAVIPSALQWRAAPPMAVPRIWAPMPSWQPLPSS